MQIDDYFAQKCSEYNLKLEIKKSKKFGERMGLSGLAATTDHLETPGGLETVKSTSPFVELLRDRAFNSPFPRTVDPGNFQNHLAIIFHVKRGRRFLAPSRYVLELGFLSASQLFCEEVLDCV